MRRTRSSRFVPQGLMGRYLRKSRGGGSGELKTPCWYKIGSKHVYFFPSEPPGCKHHQRPCPQGGKNSVDVTGLILPVGTYPSGGQRYTHTGSETLSSKSGSVTRIPLTTLAILLSPAWRSSRSTLGPLRQNLRSRSTGEARGLQEQGLLTTS